jgi:hypothetical protein
VSDSQRGRPERLRNPVTGAAAAALVALAVASPAVAQGNGNAYGHYKNPKTSSVSTSSPSAAGSPQLQIPGTGIRNFGSWLDDASVMPAGEGSVSLSFGYFRTPAYREFDVPAVDATIGVAPRVQFGFSVPFYHAGEPGGPVARGLGDLYLNAKVQLRDPSGRRVGFSVTPVLEILSYAPRPDASRASWALPGSIELQGSRVRTFATVGYFSRGSLFASGAVEVAVSDRAWVTGSISRSHSIEADQLSVALGLAQTRTDVGGAFSMVVTPTMSVYAGVGRTISKQDPNSATFSLSTGVAFRFSAWERPTTHAR